MKSWPRSCPQVDTNCVSVAYARILNAAVHEWPSDVALTASRVCSDRHARITRRLKAPAERARRDHARSGSRCEHADASSRPGERRPFPARWSPRREGRAGTVFIFLPKILVEGTRASSARKGAIEAASHRIHVPTRRGCALLAKACSIAAMSPSIPKGFSITGT
jgi:hypothetical protein